jgi:hypothetical protein
MKGMFTTNQIAMVNHPIINIILFSSIPVTPPFVEDFPASYLGLPEVIFTSTYFPKKNQIFSPNMDP